jgi:polysaccharide deacetylase family protein (PEP-CTERM system associated)
MRYAVFSMDIEDWYHLDYFSGKPVEKSYSLLDGLEQYAAIVEKHHIPSTFFTLSEIAPNIASQLRSLLDAGHEIACHGKNHERPLTKRVDVFATEIRQAKAVLEDIIGNTVEGYRAPCFSIDRDRLNALMDIGMCYDSSKIAFRDHPLYGDMDVTDFTKVMQDVYIKEKFVEFELSTLRLANRKFPVSGGAYLRILPWALMNRIVKQYLSHAELYILYIHPFELSRKALPPLPDGTGFLKTLRFTTGRSSVAAKLEKLIILLRNAGFEFITFKNLRLTLLDNMKDSKYV